MFNNNSLLTRITIGKSLGFLIGLTGFFAVPVYLPDAGYMMQFGQLFWYTFIGTVVGLFGVITWHPILRMPMPWWFRAPLIGGWMNFILVLLMYDTLTIAFENFAGPDGLFRSPFWLIAEGIIIATFIDYFCTKFGGEGKQTADM